MKLTVWRDGKTQELAVKVGTQPEDCPVARTDGGSKATTPEAGTLACVADVHPATARRDEPQAGAEIKSVAPNSLAADVGGRTPAT